MVVATCMREPLRLRTLSTLSVCIRIARNIHGQDKHSTATRLQIVDVLWTNCAPQCLCPQNHPRPSKTIYSHEVPGQTVHRSAAQGTAKITLPRFLELILDSKNDNITQFHSRCPHCASNAWFVQSQLGSYNAKEMASRVHPILSEPPIAKASTH